MPSRASPTPKLTVVVVLPVPPFWLHIAMVLQFGISLFLLLIRFGSLDPPKHSKLVLCFGGRMVDDENVKISHKKYLG